MKPFLHASEREFGSPRTQRLGDYIRRGQRCYCFNSSSETKTSTADQRVAVAESGTGVSGTGNTTAAQDSAQISGGGTVVRDEATNIGGDVVSGLQLANIQGDITLGDTQALLQSQADFSQSLKEISAQQASEISSILSSNKSQLDKVLEQQAKTAEVQQTGGTSSLQKYGAAVALAGIAAVAIMAYSGRKS